MSDLHIRDGVGGDCSQNAPVDRRLKAYGIKYLIRKRHAAFGLFSVKTGLVIRQ